jgi:hypothetical protein
MASPPAPKTPGPPLAPMAPSAPGAAPAPQPPPAPATPPPPTAAKGPPAPAAPARLERGQTSVKKLREERRFRDCRAAVDWVRAGEGGDQAEAKVAPQKGLEVKYTERDGKVVASVEVRFSLDTENSYTKIIEPTWANMNAEDKRAVKSYTAAMQAHEDGRIKLAEDYLKQAG